MTRRLTALLALACSLAGAQDSAPVRLRATVERYAAPNLVIKERSGKVLSLTMPDEPGCIEVMSVGMTSTTPVSSGSVREMTLPLRSFMTSIGAA